MRVCDICKNRKASSTKKVTIDDMGHTDEIELCTICLREFVCRKTEAEHKAYVETVKAMTGEVPRKSHWWNMFDW
jgi:hypothetical protein